MTAQDAIQKWREGAQRALAAAQAVYDIGDYTLTLFHCHLAVEKALKAEFLKQQNTAPPYTHNLALLAGKSGKVFTDDEIAFLDELTEYNVYGRYDDTQWMGERATSENALKWLQYARSFLSSLGL
ncbi:MAG: HEPN domain-containing protein [Patescibacteria group bacterium]